MDNDRDTSLQSWKFLTLFPAQVTKLATLDYNLGEAYTTVGQLLPEVLGSRAQLDFYCGQPPGVAVANSEWPEIDPRLRLSVAGKLMGLAAAGTVRESLVNEVLEWYEESAATAGGKFTEFPRVFGPRLREALCEDGSDRTLRDVAATAQEVFSRYVVKIVELLLGHVGGRGAVDGLVLTGGCALNVLANQAVVDRLGLPHVYVPPSPNDGGLAVGGVWAKTRAGNGCDIGQLQTAPLSVAFHSFRLIFRRPIISRSGLERECLSLERARAERPR